MGGPIAVVLVGVAVRAGLAVARVGVAAGSVVDREAAVEEGKKLKITWFKSQIGAEEYQKQTLRSLGLRRLNHEVVRPDNESVRGMIATVRHLVRVEELR